jgi:ABC-type spermidine/putrescine transport system permease subunit I
MMTRLRPYLPALPAVLYLTLFLVAPLILLFLLGLTESQRGVITNRWTLDFYRAILSDSFYRYLFIRTLAIALAVTLLTLILGYPVAYLYTRVGPRWRALILSAVLAPLLTSALVRTFGWMVILGSDGIVNQVLLALSIIEKPIRFVFKLNGVIIGMTQVLLPFVIMPLISALQTIPANLEDAALNLGATRWQAFWRITVPLSLPGISAGVSLAFVLAYTEFTVATLMGGGTFAVISVQIFQEMTTLLDWSKGAVLATLLLVQSGFYVFAIQWFLRKLAPWSKA